jgi:imidazolonepropionase
MRSGATVVEVKSGYGLSIEGELRLLHVIRSVAARLPIRVVATLLLHVPPAKEEVESYLQRVETELIPEAARQQLARAVDIFVEKEAWTAKQAERVLTSALNNGLEVKVHAEQFHSVGGLELALQLKALSVDHLEACTPEQHCLFRDSETIATVLPGVSLHLDIPRAPGRQLINAGAAVAVGTDLNPGSSPLFSMSAALALAVRLNGLTMQQALVAGTINAACALGLADAGRIAVGQPTDFVVLHSADWRDLIYTLGSNPVREVWARGICVVPSSEKEDRA